MADDGEQAMGARSGIGSPYCHIGEIGQRRTMDWAETPRDGFSSRLPSLSFPFAFARGVYKAMAC